MMDSPMGYAFVVVVLHGAQDVSRTTFRTSEEATRYMNEIRRQVPNLTIGMYHTRVARTPFLSF